MSACKNMNIYKEALSGSLQIIPPLITRSSLLHPEVFDTVIKPAEEGTTFSRSVYEEKEKS